MSKEDAAIKMYREWFFTISNNPHADFCMARLNALGFTWNSKEWLIPDREAFTKAINTSPLVDFPKNEVIEEAYDRSVSTATP